MLQYITIMNAHTKELLLAAWPAAFSYDHEKGMFTSGDIQYTSVDLPLSYGDLSAPTQPNELPNTAVVQTVVGAIMMPRLYDWLQANETEALHRETAEVMHDVFVGLRPDMLGKVAKHDRGGLFGFNMSRISPEHPHFSLVTLGNCACYGVESHIVFGERYWNEKIAALGFHNIDTPPQEVSLLAGLGHLAHRANQAL